MKKTIYFHIGLPKTGTTSLQSFCYKNSAILEKNGLLYPVIEKYEDPTVIINGRCFINAITKVTKGAITKAAVEAHKEQIKEELNLVWKQMKKIIDNSTADKILISCEGFVEVECVIWEFLNHSEFDIKLVVYMRNAFDQLISHYKQKAKDNYLGDYPMNLIEFIKTTPYETHYDVIESYAKYLGDENVIVRIYEKDQLKNGNTIDDFFNTIGYQKPQNLAEDATYINTSYSHDTTTICGFTKAFFAAINHNPGYYPIYELSINDIGKQSTDSLVPKELIKEICDKYYERDCRIAKKFLGRDELFSNRYPRCYYKERPEKNSQGVVISYEQLDILYEAFGKAYEKKVKIVKPLIYLVSFFIPFSQKRKAFKTKYLGSFKEEAYRKLTFSGFAGFKPYQ